MNEKNQHQQPRNVFEEFSVIVNIQRVNPWFVEWRLLVQRTESTDDKKPKMSVHKPYEPYSDQVQSAPHPTP